MPVVINGTTGISGVDGSAGTPAVQGTDTNTGMFFPAADTIAFAEGGTEVARFDSSGNLGIGTSSPSDVLTLNRAGSTNVFQRITNGANTSGFYVGLDTLGQANVYQAGNAPLLFATNATERARIDTSGNLLVGTTSGDPIGSRVNGMAFLPSGSQVNAMASGSRSGAFGRFTNTGDIIQLFYHNGSTLIQVGGISTNGTNASFNTSSDYRLKHDIAPMTGALAKVAALKPCTYKWNVDGSDGEGFIAHELAEVVPGCVSGEKDAVDADGNPVYQGIDTSFLVATLTAAIQELKAIVDAQAVEIAQLKGQA